MKCECGCNKRIITKPHHKYLGVPKYIHGHNKARYKPVRYIINKMTGCWEWQLFTMPFGHGQMNIKVGNKFKRTLAHRYYYEKYKGKIPDGLQIDHLCRNPRCVNPNHLEAVTNAVNTRRGNIAKLSPEKVKEIISLYKNGGATHRSLGEIYGVSHSVIGRVLRGESWF